MTWSEWKIILIIFGGALFIWLMADINGQWNDCVEKNGHEYCITQEILLEK
jgi:hypothetical protein